MFDYDVVIQFQKGLLVKEEFWNYFHLFVSDDNNSFIPELSNTLTGYAILSPEPRKKDIYGGFYTIKCSKLVSVKKVTEMLVEFLKENNIRFIKE